YRPKAKRNIPKNVGLVALAGVTLAVGYNTFKKADKIEPAAIKVNLSDETYNKLVSGGVSAISNITVKGEAAPINFRSSCAFEDSTEEPLNNIVFSLSAGNTLHLPVAIAVSGPSANANVSQSDVWFIVPTGKGDQSVCFDASEASRGTDFGNVTVNNGESAVDSKPDATVTLKDNTIYVNGSSISPLQVP
ncbi:MAG: hypothetical protein ACREF7_02220, partial [Candidatus Saccharimonadales bacterium]